MHIKQQIEKIVNGVVDAKVILDMVVSHPDSFGIRDNALKALQDVQRNLDKAQSAFDNNI